MDTVVRTRQGAVRGAMAEGVAVFKGIPYAAPPFGANRFQPPRPHEPWDGVRERLIMAQPYPNPRIFHRSTYCYRSQPSPAGTA